MKIPEATDTTSKRIFAAWEEQQKPRHSKRLGASQIGKPCDRAIWYSFRWAKLPHFPGRILRLFARGNIEEACVASDMKRIGANFIPLDPETGEQWTESGLGGHFVCKLDGVVQGLPEAPAAWATVEIKTAKESDFKKIDKEGCKAAKPAHWAQCQSGMGLFKIERCLYLVVNKNTDEIYTEWIHFDKDDYRDILNRAKSIIDCRTAPEKIGGPAFFECKWCDYAGVCHGQDAAEQSCRSCKHACALDDGNGWACEKHKECLAEFECCRDGDFEYAEGMVSEGAQKVADAFGGTVDGIETVSN